jgi:hypothetical protein
MQGCQKLGLDSHFQAFLQKALYITLDDLPINSLKIYHQLPLGYVEVWDEVILVLLEIISSSVQHNFLQYYIELTKRKVNCTKQQ